MDFEDALSQEIEDAREKTRAQIAEKTDQNLVKYYREFFSNEYTVNKARNAFAPKVNLDTFEQIFENAYFNSIKRGDNLVQLFEKASISVKSYKHLRQAAARAERIGLVLPEDLARFLLTYELGVKKLPKEKGGRPDTSFHKYAVTVAVAELVCLAGKLATKNEVKVEADKANRKAGIWEQNMSASEIVAEAAPMELSVGSVAVIWSKRDRSIFP